MEKRKYPKIRSVVVKGNEFTGYYCDLDTDEQFEIEGHFEVVTHPGDEPDIEVDTIESIKYQCESCHHVAVNKLKPHDFDLYELSSDILNQIDLDDYVFDSSGGSDNE